MLNGKPPVRLSKSKIAAFEHCARRLWLQIHRRDAAEFDEATLTRFQFGHDVGRRARFAVRDGVLVETGTDMAAALAETARLIALDQPKPIFEATFQFQNVLVRVDILQPLADGTWHLIEVKASTRVGGYQLADVATQVWVARGAGIVVGKATVRHLLSRVNWQRPDIASIMFEDTDVTTDIDRFLTNRERTAHTAQLIAEGEEPSRAMGVHCYRPLACEFRDHCKNCVRSKATA